MNLYADDLQATVDRVGEELASFGADALEKLVPEKAAGLVRYLEDMRDVLDAAASTVPLLRRRCDCTHQDGAMEGLDGWPVSHDKCGGRGWLYPEQPDWWHKRDFCNRSAMCRKSEEAWHHYCDLTWRVMRLYQDNGDAEQ
jgi:hypothetical protein